MARVSDEKVHDVVTSDLCNWTIREMARDLLDARSVLHNLLTGMEDRYDGAPDAKPSLPFNGNDISEIKRVL